MMFPDHWYNKKVDRLTFNNPLFDKGIEDFHNNSHLKLFTHNIRRQIESKKLLLQINLEERRNKLRNLLDAEDQVMSEEHTKRIESIEVQRDRLREYAMQIRNQKEIEQQALAAKKYFQRDRLNDDEIRSIQAKIHFSEILKDWSKIKEIKERIKREEKCESDFWGAQAQNENDKLLKKELQQEAKENNYKNEILNQIKENEKRKQLEKENNAIMQEINNDNIRKLHFAIQQERKDALNNERKRKEEYRKGLDKHIRTKNEKMDMDRRNEEAFDITMLDENEIAMKTNMYNVDKKKTEELKHLKNFIYQQNCIKEKQIAEEKSINEMIRKTDIANNKKFIELEYMKNKKYIDTVKSIRDNHESHMAKVLEERRLKVEEIKKEKEAMQKFINLELEKEVIEKEKIKQKQLHFNNTLDGQIKFNSYLKDLALQEKERELDSLRVSEEEYKKLMQQIKEKEELLFKHPWRSFTTEFH